MTFPWEIRALLYNTLTLKSPYRNANLFTESLHVHKICLSVTCSYSNDNLVSAIIKPWSVIPTTELLLKKIRQSDSGI